MKVDLLKKILQPWFMSMAPVGEDITFCAKASYVAQAKILIDTNIEAPHLKEEGTAAYEDYLATQEAKEREEGYKKGNKGKNNAEDQDNNAEHKPAT